MTFDVQMLVTTTPLAMKNIIKPITNRYLFRHLLQVAFILLLSTMSGCAQQPSVHSIEEIAEKSRIPSMGMAPWIASGKLALQSTNNSENVNFRWQRFSPDYEEITLSGPIGIGAVRIARDGRSLWWVDGDQRRPLTALALSQEGHTVLATLPFSTLGNWLLGVIEDTAPWHVEVTRYQTQSGWYVPQTLSMYLSSDQPSILGDRTVKTVVLKWQIEANPTPDIAQTPP